MPESNSKQFLTRLIRSILKKNNLQYFNMHLTGWILIGRSLLIINKSYGPLTICQTCQDNASKQTGMCLTLLH